MNNNRSGHVVFKMFILTVIIALVVGAIYFTLMQITMSVRCTEQLTRIYQALELFEMDRGALPRLAFYPDEPMTDPDSIRVVLEEYGVDPTVWICPSAHRKVSATGLTYVWNSRLNGANLRSFGERQWMLIEINALSTDVNAPHLRYYNVLYTDGKVERIRDPLETLRGL
ncbi:MAG TPA: hypothetical protein PJ991_09665 [Kiritimatiellia bacterium]|nr:hypothetical protein [Kiritimatiellia bacterium]